MKTPILRSGGLGLVNSEAEFDKLIDSTEDEWNRTEGSEIDFYIFVAQKPESNWNTVGYGSSILFYNECFFELCTS